MENKEKYIEEAKADIRKRLERSDKEKWKSLTDEERELVVNKFLDLRSIEHLGIDKILDNSRGLRQNFAFLILGVLFGVSGNLAAGVLVKYLPDSFVSDIFYVVLFVISLWLIIRFADNSDADFLKHENILEYLLKIVKREESRQDGDI